MNDEEIQRYVRNLKIIKIVVIVMLAIISLSVLTILGFTVNDYLTSPQLDQLILQ